MKRSRRKDGRFISFKQKTLPTLSVFCLTLGICAGVQYEAPASLLRADREPMIVRSVYAKEPEKPKTHIEFTDDQVLDYIHQRESTGGKNNPVGSLANNCYVKGKWNELGYSGMQGGKCFENKEEGERIVKDWIHRHLTENKNDIVKTLCFYNTGSKEACEYGETFLKQTGNL